MKLSFSLIVTAFITLSVWLLVLLQPSPVNATASITEHSNDSAPTTTDKRYIRGVSDVIPLQDTQQLWQRFYTEIAASNSLPSDQLWVVYQGFDDNFTTAKVSIGYVVSGPANNDLLPLPQGSKQQILAKGDHSVDQLTQAWQGINFSKPIKAVVEIHYLNQHQLPTSSEVFVYYR